MRFSFSKIFKGLKQKVMVPQCSDIQFRTEPYYGVSENIK